VPCWAACVGIEHWTPKGEYGDAVAQFMRGFHNCTTNVFHYDAATFASLGVGVPGQQEAWFDAHRRLFASFVEADDVFGVGLHVESRGIPDQPPQEERTVACFELQPKKSGITSLSTLFQLAFAEQQVNEGFQRTEVRRWPPILALNVGRGYTTHDGMRSDSKGVWRWGPIPDYYQVKLIDEPVLILGGFTYERRACACHSVRMER
jgi:hypothetical protein